MDPQGAVADDDPAPGVSGSSNGVAPESERSNENVAATALSQIDVLLARACDLSRQVPTTSARLSHTEGILPPGHGFDAEAAKEGLSKEAALLDHLQKATFHLRSSFALFKSVQDDRCRPYEDEAKSFTKRMEEEEAAAAQGSERGMEAPADEVSSLVEYIDIDSALCFLQCQQMCALSDAWVMNYVRFLSCVRSSLRRMLITLCPAMRMRRRRPRPRSPLLRRTSVATRTMTMRIPTMQGSATRLLLEQMKGRKLREWARGGSSSPDGTNQCK